MIIPVYNDNGVWKRWLGEPNVNPARVAQLVERGLWGPSDYESYGIAMATSFEVPAGKTIVGAERFEADINGIRQVFDVEDYVEPVVIPDVVSRRQFKLQLAISGLTDVVEGWVAQQDPLVQIAYNESGSFYRNEPAMSKGLQDLGFSEEQIDDFFLAASLL